MTPLPGTPIWNFAKEKGLVSTDVDWSRLKFDFTENYEKAVILSQTLTRDELYKLFLLFQKEQKKRVLKHRMRIGIKNPMKIPKFLIKQVQHNLSRKFSN